MQAETPISHVKKKLPLTSGVNTPMKNLVRANANLKRKSALGELGEALEMIMEQHEKRRQHRDIEMKATRRLADENLGVRQQLKLAWERELKLAELEDKKAEQAFLLEMKRMELLKESISVPPPKKHKGNFY